MKLHKITFCTIFILPLLMGWNASQSAAQTAAEPSIQYGHTHDITSVRWSPDNRRLVSYSAADYYIRMWDVDSGRLIWSAYTEILQKKDEYFTLGGFAWSPDQTLIATHSGNGTVQVWNAINGKLKWNADAHTESASLAVFSHDGKYLLSAGEKDKVHALKLWDVSSGKLILEFAGDPGVVIAGTFSVGDKIIKTGNLDAEVSEWEVSTGRRLATR